MRVVKNVSVKDISYEIKAKKLRKTKKKEKVAKSLVYDPDEEILEMVAEEVMEDLSYYDEIRQSMSNW